MTLLIPLPATLRIVSVVGFASFCSTLGSATLGASPCSGPTCGVQHQFDEDGLGSVSLLQTSLHVDRSTGPDPFTPKAPTAKVKPEPNAEQLLPADMIAAEVSLRHGMVHNISCNALLSVDVHRSYEVLRSLGHLPKRKVCRLDPPLFPMQKPPLRLQQLVGLRAWPQLPWGHTILFGYIVFVVTTIGCMLRSLMSRSPATISASKSAEGLSCSGDQHRPEAEAWKSGLISWFLISWVGPWVTRWGNPDNATVTKIKACDLGGLGDIDDECAQNVQKMAKLWKEHCTTERAGFDATWSMIRLICMFAGYGKIAVICTTTAIYMILCFLTPAYAIHWTLDFLALCATKQAGGDPFTLDTLAYPLAIVIFLFTGLAVLEAAFCTFSFLLNARVNLRLQGALTALVYAKAQRLPASMSTYDLRADFELARTDEWGYGRTADGGYSLVQLITVDINSYLVGLINTAARCAVILPIMIILLGALINRLGYATIAAIGAVFLTIVWIANAFINQFYYLRACQGLGGQRLVQLQEFMFGVRIVKSYAWEDKAEAQINHTRNGELGFLRGFFIWTGIVYGTMITFPRLICCVVLICYSVMYQGIRASDIFVLVQLLGAFQASAQAFAAMMPALMLAGPSLARLQIFLTLPEADLPASKTEERPSWATVWPAPPLLGDMDAAAKANNSLHVQGSYSWQKGQPPMLHNLDLKVEQGQVVAVLGGVGSGKSTLLNSLLGELVPNGNARLSLPERTAYHSQVAHVREGTLKDNILFCQSYDEQRYNKAVFAASLRQDLNMLPGGDSVPIGSRGITLSGGQRARVSMARAVYSMGTPVVLLDDPFASVDRTTGKHILENLIFGPLMEGRSCVVVMQPDHQALQKFDKVVIMENGTIVAQGSPEDVVKSDAYKSLLSVAEKTSQNSGELASLDTKLETPSVERQSSAPNESHASTPAMALRDEENEGRIDMTAMKYYCFHGGNYMCVFCVFFYFLMVICNLFVDTTMARWTNAELSGEVSGGAGFALDPSQVKLNVNSFIIQSMFWLACSVALYGICFYFGMTVSLNISTKIHNAVLKRLLHAPVDRFYDKTPVGRILNRMSNDMSNIDFKTYMQVTSTIGQLLTWMVPMGYVHMVMPFLFSIGMIPWYAALYTLIRQFTNIVVPLRYLVNVTRSEVNTHMSEVENSKTTVRAYQVHSHFSSDQMGHVDNLLKAQFASDCTQRWVCNRILLLYSFFSTSIVLIGLMIPSSTSMGVIGLCLVNAVRIIMSVDFVVENLSAAQFEFISMNRLYEYLEIPQERDDVLPGDSKLMSKTHMVIRKSLGNLESCRSQETGLISISSVDPAKPASRQVIFEQMDKVSGFAFKGVKALKWAINLATPETEMTDVVSGKKQAEATRADDLDVSHYLVSVSGRRDDPAAIADELCHGSGEEVVLLFNSSWMTGGAHIQITDLVAGYADSPVQVLKSISLEIQPRSKVAICGTTGCGKSTTILCMLRILEPRSGKIEINNVNTQDIGLRALRRSLGLVPQDPVVFSGTIRSNLDPFFEFPDELIWEALKSVQLAGFVFAHGFDLYMPINPDGANLSFGQRQLLCVARMILRQPGLLLLDECTSAIDPRTQELVQCAIRESFPNSTLIVVAHRLETILDFDAVVVMEQGRIIEKGSVQALADQKGGKFHEMLNAGGVSRVPTPRKLGDASNSSNSD